MTSPERRLTPEELATIEGRAQQHYRKLGWQETLRVLDHIAALERDLAESRPQVARLHNALAANCGKQACVFCGQYFSDFEHDDDCEVMLALAATPTVEASQ